MAWWGCRATCRARRAVPEPQGVPAAVPLRRSDRRQTGRPSPRRPPSAHARPGARGQTKEGRAGNRGGRARRAPRALHPQDMIWRSHRFMPGIKDENGEISAGRVTGRAQNVGLRAQIGNPHPQGTRISRQTAESQTCRRARGRRSASRMQACNLVLAPFAATHGSRGPKPTRTMHL